MLNANRIVLNILSPRVQEVAMFLIEVSNDVETTFRKTRLLIVTVIGYWEAWNARSKCHNTQAMDLPRMSLTSAWISLCSSLFVVEALTHVNYAFAYIDPASFEITTMDAQTPVSTFQDAVDLKALKPDLKVFVSIGGWTFSDNGTATQPVFGNIARSSTNREKFAKNVLKFLNSYGFDGVDLDWYDTFNVHG